MAVANYTDANGHYPPAYLPGPDGRPWHSWRVLVLPYIEQYTLFKEYRFDEPWDGPNNRRLAGRMPSLYRFHAGTEPDTTTSNYLAVVGPETLWPGTKKVTPAAVTDRLASTILVVENLGLGVHWMEPRDLVLADMDLRVNSPAGVSSPYTWPGVAMLDGSLHTLRAELRPEVLRALLTIDGNEPLADDGAGGWDFLADGRDRPLVP
ncbi:hypothetical protein ETAA1_49360 [Urbifossiella limnaea]|uniref:DUF1559 domain-containing protein n=1 Tax=Urbifossiella limnaea TaxID=2528023 RepID=A0A517XZK9_9BACT|nr:hypothetical protein ETAA1_49360 [Urbifossiella limnaea]